MSQLARTAILNVVGLTSRHIGPATPRILEFTRRPGHVLAQVQPLVPAVTSTMQATYLTGLPPAGHGIVANCWYDRDYAEHRNWKQSNRLVHARKLWEHLREADPGYTAAKMFWWNNLYSSADWSATPRPIYRSDGSKIFDIQTWPMDLREQLKQSLGPFPFQAFWGPMAGIGSSRWIAAAARFAEERHAPGLSLVYLPHLDYPLQKRGPGDPSLPGELGQIDAVAGDLIDRFEERGVQVALLSEYGITEVDRPVHLNRVFREKGWITCREELGTDMIDLGNCRAFAIADHQVAHVYVNDKAILQEVRDTLAAVDGVAEVLQGDDMARQGLEHARSGDLVAVSDARSWFTYYYWMDDARAPDYARAIDIHRKPGYDPCEMFFDPGIRFPKLKAAGKLARKALGFRTVFDLIPLDASLVKGSHGRVPEEAGDYPILAGPFPSLEASQRLTATDVYQHLHQLCSRPREASA